MNKKHRIFLSFSLSAIWILFICLTLGIYFETNDDRFFSEIFSGVMTGTPEAHAYYINYILALPISLLYRITTAVPWYGLCLVFFQFLCWFFILDAFLSKCHGKADILWGLLLAGVLFLSGFYLIANIQFTSTAAFLALAGHLCFLLYPEGRGKHLVFFLLELLAFLLRSDAMLMMQPLGFSVLFFYSLTNYDSSSKNFYLKRLRPVITALLLALLIILLGKGSHFLSYHSEGWREYEKINDAVTELTDYAIIPAYEEVKPILDKYQVTEKQYSAFFRYAMIEDNLSADCLSELALVAHEKNTPPDCSFMLQELKSSYTTEEYWNINNLLITVWLISFFYIFLQKSFSLLLPLLGLFCSRSILWLYLIYHGRTPARVMLPLYLGEISLLLCLLWLYYHKSVSTVASLSGNEQPQQKFLQYKKILLLSCLGIILLAGLRTVKPLYQYLKDINTNQAAYISGMRDIQAYCNNHPENHYFIESSALIYYRGSAFETAIYQPRNAVITGCWYSGAPVLNQYMKDYFGDNPTLYLITSADLEMQSLSVLQYLEERFHADAVLSDSYTVSNGGIYNVYCLTYKNF